MELTPTTMADQAEFGLTDVTAALEAGDEVAASLARQIRAAVAGVSRSSREAYARSRSLHLNDEMNPQGRARKLAELPAELRAATEDQLRRALENLEYLELHHRGRILRHDPRNDASLRWELDNFLAGVKPDEAAMTLLGLARTPRFATFLGGDAGRSLAARCGLKDTGALAKNALEALIEGGNEEQVARGRALAAVKAARVKIDKAREGRDTVLEEIPRPPRPAPSGALK